MKSRILDYNILKEEISPDNVLAMSELIAFSEVRYLIGIISIALLSRLEVSTLSCMAINLIMRDKNEWIIVENTHEPIISKSLWDKVKEVEKSVSRGKKTKRGYTHPLSGFLFCADCGGKMKLHYMQNNGALIYNFNCGNHVQLGKAFCFSHHITAKALEQIVFDDIREKARYITIDEQAARDEYLRYNSELTDNTVKVARKELKAKQRRLEELSRLMQVAYEDRVKGKLPEDICLSFIRKYSDEQKTIKDKINILEEQLSQTENTTHNVDEFIRNIKKYLDVPELIREMCYELIDRIVIGGLPKITGKARTIDIVYKVDIASVLRHKLKA